MDYNRINVRRVVEEDRLSSLPDELFRKILSRLDMKDAVQTCSLSSRWKFLWKSLPCLNFSSQQFRHASNFVKFVTHVLSHRNHQIEVSSVKLDFHEELDQSFVEKIANYAYLHNVEELSIVYLHSDRHDYPPCLFSSQSLKHFSLTSNHMRLCDKTTTPWDFPALTTLNLNEVSFLGDVFSKFVNLQKLTLEGFTVLGNLEEAFDIITPRLSNLILIKGYCPKTMNVIAPELENLTIRNCKINYLNAPSGLSSLHYKSQVWSYGLVQFPNDGFHSLNEVSIRLSTYSANKEEDARKTINILQKLLSVKYLTLNADTVECISSFPDLLSQHSSPFRNLIRLTIDYRKRKDAYEVTMSNQAKTFLLDNSPNASLIMITKV